MEGILTGKTPAGVQFFVRAEQVESLRLLAQGMSRAQVAAQQCVSESAVTYRIRRVLDALGANNGVEAAVILAGAGLL